MLIRKILSVSILCFVSVGFIGCVLDNMKETRRGANIIEKDSGWEIDHPRDNATGRRLDKLKNKDMTVWILFIKDKENEYFRIETVFMEVKNPIEFSPSRITLKRSNGETLRGKATSCDNKTLDLKSLRLYKPLPEPIRIDRVEKYHMVGVPCYTLFFDSPAPPVEEEFIMFINDAFTSNSIKMDIPPIYFRKTIDNNIRFGLGVE